MQLKMYMHRVQKGGTTFKKICLVWLKLELLKYSLTKSCLNLHFYIISAHLKILLDIEHYIMLKLFWTNLQEKNGIPYI